MLLRIVVRFLVINACFLDLTTSARSFQPDEGYDLEKRMRELRKILIDHAPKRKMNVKKLEGYQETKDTLEEVKETLKGAANTISEFLGFHNEPEKVTVRVIASPEGSMMYDGQPYYWDDNVKKRENEEICSIAYEKLMPKVGDPEDSDAETYAALKLIHYEDGSKPKRIKWTCEKNRENCCDIDCCRKYTEAVEAVGTIIILAIMCSCCFGAYYCVSRCWKSRKNQGSAFKRTGPPPYSTQSSGTMGLTPGNQMQAVQVPGQGNAPSIPAGQIQAFQPAQFGFNPANQWQSLPQQGLTNAAPSGQVQNMQPPQPRMNPL